jgi:hypothetical protein
MASCFSIRACVFAAELKPSVRHNEDMLDITERILETECIESLSELRIILLCDSLRKET